MRLALHAVIMVLLASVNLSQAHAELPFEQFTNACVSKCSKAADGEYCAKFCQCTVDAIKASGDDAAQSAAMSNTQALTKINMACTGKFGLEVFAKSCAANCKGAACTKCDCVASELKKLGSETEVGEFFTAISGGDANAKSRMTAIQTKCMN